MLIDDLKKECESKRETVERLYKSVCEKIIIRDIHDLLPDVQMQNGKYLLRENVCMSIVNGNLEIMDCRSTSFLWLFEILSDINASDGFFFEGRWYRVRDIIDEKFTSEMQVVINRLEISLERLQKNESFSYKYYCDHENVEVNSLEGVLKKVLTRKLF